MILRKAEQLDCETISKIERSLVRSSEITNLINLGRILILEAGNGEMIGLLRFNLFWDDIPFLNSLYVRPECENNGYEAKMIDLWETQLKEEGYVTFITSTVSDSPLQTILINLGYKAVGGFCSTENCYEIILKKEVDEPVRSY